MIIDHCDESFVISFIMLLKIIYDNSFLSCVPKLRLNDEAISYFASANYPSSWTWHNKTW